MKETEKQDKKKILLLMIIVLITLIAAAVAISFAFFSYVIHGNDEASSVIIRAADIRIVFDNREVIIEDNFYPGDSVSTEFSVENMSNHELFYAIEWKDVGIVVDTHAFTTGDLVYEIKPKGTSNGITINPTATPSVPVVIEEGISLAGRETHTYILTITYINAPDRNQIANIGATFLGRIDITSSQRIHHNPTP